MMSCYVVIVLYKFINLPHKFKYFSSQLSVAVSHLILIDFALNMSCAVAADVHNPRRLLLIRSENVNEFITVMN